MKRIYIRIFMAIAVSGLTGCSPLYQNAVVMEEAVAVEPVATETVRNRDSACKTTTSSASDGIGGTGCPVE